MSDFSLTFLGTGTSQGIPMIACDCTVCQSPDPRDRRSRSSIFVKTPEQSLIVVTGPDLRLQVLRERIRDVDAVLFTHPHADHIMGFDDMRGFCHGGKEMPIYGSPDTIAAVKRVFAFAFDGKNRFPGYVHPVPHEVTTPFRLGETEIIPVPVPHGRTQTQAYIFVRKGRKIVGYFPDCKALPPEAREAAAGVEVLIVDALRRREHPTHMNVEEALETARAINAPRTYFTHLCHDLGHAQLESELPPGIQVAYDGLRLDL